MATSFYTLVMDMFRTLVVEYDECESDNERAGVMLYWKGAYAALLLEHGRNPGVNIIYNNWNVSQVRYAVDAHDIMDDHVGFAFAEGDWVFELSDSDDDEVPELITIENVEFELPGEDYDMHNMLHGLDDHGDAAVSAIAHNWIQGGEAECGVCGELIEETRVCINEHAFCSPCIDQWAQVSVGTCPICRIRMQ